MGRKRDANRALKIALEQFGFNEKPQLVRAMSSDVVFRVGRLAAKVFPVDKDLTLLERRLAVLRTVETNLWVSAIDGVLHKNEYGSIAFYPWASRAGTGKWPELGALLREVHHLEIASVQELPRWTPLSKTAMQLSRYSLDPNSEPDVGTTVMSARTRLLEQIAGLESDLGFGFIHGDVSPSNTARIKGRLAFIDLDECAYGPREYDLVGAAMRLRTGEISAGTYSKFCKAYGYDVRDWKFLPIVEEIAALGAAAFILGEEGAAGHQHPLVVETLERWGQPVAARSFEAAQVSSESNVVDRSLTDGSRFMERGLTMDAIEFTN